jgi:hypothetical protein
VSRWESVWSEPIVFKLIVDTHAESKRREVGVEARVTIADARFVGGGSDIKEAMDSLLGAVRNSPERYFRGRIVSYAMGHGEEGMSPQERYFRALGRRPPQEGHSRMVIDMPPQEGYYRMFARTFAIEVPLKRNEENEAVEELTDEEARPIHAALFRILDEAEREIRRKLEATYPTFKLRSQ